jgi:hypothetical protein
MPIHSTSDVIPESQAMDGAVPAASFLFDLDGTLVDSVYQHVLAWREALDVEGIEVSVWRIHRKIGMSGGLFTDMLLRETGFHIDSERRERLRNLHAAAFNRQSASWLSHTCWDPFGNRDEWPDGNGTVGSGNT